MTAQTKSRRYSSDRRRQQAEQTRADVLRAAARVFAESGWSGTTLAEVAAAAGVAVETVYAGFKTKKNLLRQAFEVSLVGDAEPVPLSARAEYAKLSQGTLAARMRAGARLAGEIYRRSARLWLALRDAAAGDPEVAGWCREYEAQRRVQNQDGLQRILGRKVDARQLDLIWALLSPEVYLKLVDERRWSTKAYEEWLSRGVLALAGDLPEL